MYCLNKIVGVLLNPLVMALLAAVLGWLLAAHGRKRFGLAIVGCSIAWLWIWSTSLMTWIV